MYSLAIKRIAASVSLVFSASLCAQGLAPVEVELPEQTEATQRIALSGTVVAEKRSSLSTRVDGAVAKVFVDAGSVVEKGSVLAELDDAIEQQEMKRLQALQQRAQALVNENQRLVLEAERLVPEKHLPLTELELRQAALAVSRGDLKAASSLASAQQQRLQYHKITAPFSGVVVSKLTEEGEWVARGTPLFELVASGRAYLDVQVPQAQYRSIGQDAQIVIRPDTHPQLSIIGKIAAQVPVANAENRTFRVRLVSASEDFSLVPGSSATAEFTIKQSDRRVLTIPKDALLRNPDDSLAVFIVRDDGDQQLALRRRVTTGSSLGDRLEILSGIEAEDRVVTRGNELLRNNQRVRIK